MYRPEIKVLDCTIRDGGLINEHLFEDKFVRAVFQAVSAAGVDYIELGYRASAKYFSPEKFGKAKFCSEDFIRKVIEGVESNTKISTMVDIGRVDPEDIPLKKDSVVSMMRVACYVKDIDKAIDLVKHCADKGYETTVNIMAISTALMPDLEEGLAQLAECPLKAVYIVDSFGALFSEQVHFLTKLYSDHLKPKGIEVGIHCHNNQQLGFANTIEAIRQGANYIRCHDLRHRPGGRQLPAGAPAWLPEEPEVQARPDPGHHRKRVHPAARKDRVGLHDPGHDHRHPQPASPRRDRDARQKRKKELCRIIPLIA